MAGLTTCYKVTSTQLSGARMTTFQNVATPGGWPVWGLARVGAGPCGGWGDTPEHAFL